MLEGGRPFCVFKEKKGNYRRKRRPSAIDSRVPGCADFMFAFPGRGPYVCCSICPACLTSFSHVSGRSLAPLWAVDWGDPQVHAQTFTVLRLRVFLGE